MIGGGILKDIKALTTTRSNTHNFKIIQNKKPNSKKIPQLQIIFKAIYLNPKIIKIKNRARCQG